MQALQRAFSELPRSGRPVLLPPRIGMRPHRTRRQSSIGQPRACGRHLSALATGGEQGIRDVVEPRERTCRIRHAGRRLSRRRRPAKRRRARKAACLPRRRSGHSDAKTNLQHALLQTCRLCTFHSVFASVSSPRHHCNANGEGSQLWTDTSPISVGDRDFRSVD